jgi:hypothetical protein
MPVDILQRKVDEMSIRVYTHRMGMRNRDVPFINKSLSVFTKDENIARFGGYIQPFESGIKCQHVRVFTNGMRRQDLHGIQVYDGKHVILLSGHKGEPSRLIQRDSVGAFNTGHGVAANDPQACRIDCYNFVFLVNRN